MRILEALDALNTHPPIRRRIRHADLPFLIAAGEDEVQLAFSGGKVVETTTPPALSIRMDAEAWKSFCSPVPPPGRHDFSAMSETGQAQIEGDLLELYRFFPVMRDVIGALAGKELGR